MRIKNKSGNSYIEFWPTRVSKARRLWVHGVLQTYGRIHFFLCVERSPVIHVVSFFRNSPYRLSDESQATGYMDKYFDTEPEIVTFYKNRKSHKFRTWKLWGTDYIKEMDRNYSLSDYQKEHDPELFQYLIVTENEWIEVIGGEPEWKTFKNKKIKDIYLYYLKIDNNI